MRALNRVGMATIVFFVLTGCSAPGKSPTQIAANFINKQDVITTSPIKFHHTKNPQAVALYTKDKVPHTAYRIIGLAKVSKYNLWGLERQEKTMNEMMRTLAASVGGDGLININSDTDHTQANIIAFQKILI